MKKFFLITVLSVVLIGSIFADTARTSVSQDEFTGEQSIIFILDDSDSAGSLGLNYDVSAGRIDFFFYDHDDIYSFEGNTIEAKYKFDDGETIQTYFYCAKADMAYVFNEDDINYINNMMTQSDKFIVRIYGSDTKTYVFDMAPLMDEIDNLGN